MVRRAPGAEGDQLLDQTLGYLNFSSGTADPQFLANLNELFRNVLASAATSPPPAAGSPPVPNWAAVVDRLAQRLAVARQTSPTFQDAEQAASVLDLLRQHVVPGYLKFHRDLLFHQDENWLVGPFFLGRVCEAVLKAGPPWNEPERIVSRVIAQLNDYLGHRPVAVLESQKIEPYRHEWVRPVPLYVRGAGVSVGPHEEVVRTALELLEQTDDDLLRAAYFDPKLLDELAVDPRAYDFDHPVNKRPNYHFGQWDPHHIDNQGRFRRFVVQQVTLDALMQRLIDPSDLPREELLFEAAAVLAGTVLMAAGVSGAGPETHDSTVTLSNLLPSIAAYRDAFYERLFGKTGGEHAARLRAEAVERRQPFGGARQHLNAQLARRRAAQLEHVHLAKIFARMGFPDAAARQADVVPVASARMICRIDCRLTSGRRALEVARLEEAARLLPEIMDLLRRAIECGAVIDPWNIIGFDAHFSLFPALENSIRDHRADELVALMEQVFALYSQVWSEAAAVDDQELCRSVSRQFRESAEWWRKYAAHEVQTVEATDALDAYHAAEHVAEALNLWHKGGAAAGNIGFWAPHAAMFDSPKAYALVIEALLQRSDYVASMALLIHWLGQADRVPLERGPSSFHRLAEAWQLQLRRACLDTSRTPEEIDRTWSLVGKFFDYAEANAEDYWLTPEFQLGSARERTGTEGKRAAGDFDEGDDEQGDVFGAAYDEMVYQDTTDDGIEGEVVEGGSQGDDGLEHETKRLSDRLAFLSCLARLWKLSAVSPAGNACDVRRAERTEKMRHWITQAAQNRRGLYELLDAVHHHRIPTPTGDHDSMVEYDRRRWTKESLLDRIIATSVETADAERLLLAAVAASAPPEAAQSAPAAADLDDDQRQVVGLFAAVLRRDADGVRAHWSDFISSLSAQPLLYVPLSKGGQPRQIVAARVRQQTIQDLLAWLPRLGLFVETCRLLETAREMERNHPVGPGAVTEFDEMFTIGYKSLVLGLVESSARWTPAGKKSREEKKAAHAQLVQCLEQLTESLLVSWLAHSRTLRLSVLEKVKDKPSWSRLVAFIEKYGAEIFTQRFFNLGNVRAILHQGVETWLKQLEEFPGSEPSFRLLDDLDGDLPREEAIEHLTLVLEAIIENFAEYRDYNSTTTQSDKGELLYMLLDFLRLRTSYDRVSWNLKPVVLAHEILVRRAQGEAAQMWRRALTEKIRDKADGYLSRLAELQKKYAMRMPTVADRLAERFLKPLAIDRIRALVEPAIREAERGTRFPTFELLEHETEVLTREPTGVGLDVPAWLMALEEEVEVARQPSHEKNVQAEFDNMIPPLALPLDDVKRQLNDWSAGDAERK